MTSGRTGHWTKMHQSLVKFSESEASNHTPSLADFTTTTPEPKFSVLTPGFSRSSRSCCRGRAQSNSAHPFYRLTSVKFAAVHESGYDAVDGSSTGTRMLRMW